MGDGKGEALRSAPLKALLHQREAVFPAEQTDITQKMKGHLHILINNTSDLQSASSFLHQETKI